MKKTTTFEEHLTKYRGKKGSAQRKEFEEKSLAFRIGEMLKKERKKARLTQEQLALRTGTKKSYISRVEQGKADIQLSTFFKLVEVGLRRQLSIQIA